MFSIQCCTFCAFYGNYFRPVINSEIWTSRIQAGWLAPSLLSDELLWDVPTEANLLGHREEQARPTALRNRKAGCPSIQP